MRQLAAATLIAVGSLAAQSVFAGEDDVAEMQKKLNAQVMEKPFTVEDQQKIDAYVTEAMQKNLKPKERAPEHWAPGYTCQNLWHYSYNEYRDCVYYHRYYGRYW